MHIKRRRGGGREGGRARTGGQGVADEAYLLISTKESREKREGGRGEGKGGREGGREGGRREGGREGTYQWSRGSG